MTLSAAADINTDLLCDLPSSVAIYAEPEELIESDNCDVVIISVPTQFHEELALKALTAGKHVILEKPMASSLEACRRILVAARENNRLLTMGFNHRYFEAIKDIRATIGSGKIGALKYVKGFTGHTGLSEFKSAWMYDKDIMGGGTLMDNGIHMLDLMRYLMGGVTEVSGMIGTEIWQLDRSEDNAFVHLSSEKGVLGTLHSSWSEWRGYHFYIDAYGDRGMVRAYYAPMFSMVISLDRPGGKRSISRNFYPKSIIREKFRGWQSTVVQTFLEEFADFSALVRGESGRTIATAIDGYRSIEIPNAVYRSHMEKRTIQLEPNVGH